MSCLFVEQLTVIDCAYLDAVRGLVGESWIVDVELDGALDGQSMVLDFGEVKKRLKRAIDASLDHSLLVPRRAPGLQLNADGERLRLRFEAAPGLYEHVSPTAAVSLVDAAAITPDAVAAHLRPILAAHLPANVARLGLHLRSEHIDGAYYHYVHGLKKHAGLCQRIAHGHRSRIEVRVDGARDGALERDVAERWRDIYLGTREDIVARGDGRIRFAYTAREGRYELALPEARCDLLDTDSTVEQIAAHLAARLAPSRPGRALAVRAYEGVMKGAIARTGGHPEPQSGPRD
ncbi:6-carboxytetrahydropterin synthase [Solimonas variicoloris]|uniref:6-carboxytetrahydropterin synthase n=1 Tax=Solimonas variicoloris TaxID=254408 RepID=UPI00037D91BB|nr:6-carboxytetrahydropterin synthase [Solimonas variicoloris]